MEQGNINPPGKRVCSRCRTKDEFQHRAFLRRKLGGLDAPLDLTRREQHRIQHKVKHRGEELHGQVYADKQMEKAGAPVLLWQALEKEGVRRGLEKK